MSQADLEKAYTEAVDQLARAVEANRLLTERLEAQELTLARLRALFTDHAISGLAYGMYHDYTGMEPHDVAYNKGVDNALEMVQLKAEDIDRPAVASHTQEPPG